MVIGHESEHGIVTVIGTAVTAPLAVVDPRQGKVFRRWQINEQSRCRSIATSNRVDVSGSVWRVSSNIRRVRRDDIETVVAFALRAWAPVFESFRQVLGDAIYAQVYPDWLTSQAAAVMGACRDGNMDVFVAEEQDRVVGYVAVIFHDDPPCGEIEMIAVDPDFQRRGVASALTSFALDHTAARGFSLAIVATGGDLGHAPARRTYEKAGFVGLPLVRYYKGLVHVPEPAQTVG